MKKEKQLRFWFGALSAVLLLAVAGFTTGCESDTSDTTVPGPGATTATLKSGVSTIGTGYTVQTALDWIKANAVAATNYTIELYANDTLNPYILNSAAVNNKTGVTITLKGDSAERTLTVASNGVLLTVGGGVTLTLDNFITLKGKTSNTGNGVVSVGSGGTLTMKTGSKITGNSTSGTTGGVYVTDGTFTMTGGEISGNATTASAASTGGVYINGGSASISGTSAIISGNTGRYSDVFLYTTGSTVTLSGSPTIGGITLFVNSGTFSKINVSATLTSTCPVDLASYNSNNLTDVKNAWVGLTTPQIITGANALWAGKFTLRKFVHNAGNTSPVTTEFPGAGTEINTSGELVLVP